MPPPPPRWPCISALRSGAAIGSRYLSITRPCPLADHPRPVLIYSAHTHVVTSIGSRALPGRPGSGSARDMSLLLQCRSAVAVLTVVRAAGDAMPRCPLTRFINECEIKANSSRTHVVDMGKYITTYLPTGNKTAAVGRRA